MIYNINVGIEARERGHLCICVRVFDYYEKTMRDTYSGT